MGLKLIRIQGLEHSVWDGGEGGLLCPAHLPVAPWGQAPLVGQPQLQIDFTFLLGWLGAVPQLGHHLPKVPLVLFHSSIGLYSRHQVQWHLMRPRSQGTGPPLPLPLAFGVPGVAWHQEDGDGQEEELGRKTTGQRPEPSIPGPKCRLGQGGEGSFHGHLAYAHLLCVGHWSHHTPPWLS